MKFLIFLIFLGLTVFACGSESPKKKVDGKKIYKEYCVACHGMDGDMGAGGAFNLMESKLSLDEKIEVITNGRNVMVPFKGSLSTAKIKAVAEYTEKLKKKN